VGLHRDSRQERADRSRLLFTIGPSAPANAIPTLPLIKRVYTYLSSLPRSSSHPCSPSTQSALSSAKEGYLVSRRDYIVTRCINPVVREFDHLAEGPMSPGREEEGRKEKCRIIARVIECLTIMMQVSFRSRVERQAVLAHSRFSDPSLKDRIRLVGSSLPSFQYIRLDVHLQSAHQDAQRPARQSDQHHQTVSQCKYVLRSFPEILVDVRAPMATGPRDMSTSSIADITYTVSTNSHAGSSWLIDHNRNRRCRPSPIWKTSRRTKPLSRSYSLRSAIAIG